MLQYKNCLCVYIYIFFFFSLYIYRMYVRVWTGMDDPTRRDAPLVLHKHFQALLTLLQSLCIGSWHIMVLLAQVQSHRPWLGSRRSSFPFHPLLVPPPPPPPRDFLCSHTFLSLLPKNVLLDNAVTYRRVHFYKNIFGP